jgi:hypothetical protein
MFDHPSQLHGIMHTYRVMCHASVLGQQVLDIKGQKLVLLAAFIHDMARKHDGYCTEHGSWAAEKKVSVIRNLFSKGVFRENDLDIIKYAVMFHSLPEEPDPSHHAYHVAAVLKDSDALDRFRLGDHNLRTEFLRFPFSLTMTDFARDIFKTSQKLNFRSFTDVLKHADQINQKYKLTWSNIL